jgi:hypothetical protein
MLLEEVEAEIDFVSNAGAKACEARDTGKAREAADRADTLVAFRDKVAVLRREWEGLSKAEEQEDEQTRAERRNPGKLRKGLRTPTEAYFQPILRTLEEMGGRGKVSEVLDRVGQIMKPVLRDVDCQPLNSDPDIPRWRNAAQWARNTMRQDGLIKEDSPHGTWAISDKGRATLRAPK